MAEDTDADNIKPKVVYIKDECLSLECEWGTCQRAFTEMEPFVNHVRSHLRKHSKDDLKCPWTDCGYVSDSIEEKTRHVTFHPYHVKLKCLGTSYLNRMKAACCPLNNEERNVTPLFPFEFHCLWEDCLIRFNDTCEFYDHTKKHLDISEEQYDPTGIPCLWIGCGGRFESVRRLKEHLRSHTEEKMAACSVCGALFANRTKLFDHVTRLSEKKLYKCSYCLKQFASERLLRNHTRSHINMHKCPYCDMTTRSPSDIGIHIAYCHSTEKPFSCAHCVHKAKSLSDLRRHLLTHGSELPFACPYPNCEYASRSNYCLLRHKKKVHEGVQPNYKCHNCEKCFGRGGSLTAHLIKIHGYKRPSGHAKFRYAAHDDGYYRLVMVRYESLEISQEITAGQNIKSLEEDSNKDSEHSSKFDVIEQSTRNAPSINHCEDENNRCNETSQELGTVIEPNAKS